jgi:hypothetical protein
VNRERDQTPWVIFKKKKHISSERKRRFLFFFKIKFDFVSSGEEEAG